MTTLSQLTASWSASERRSNLPTVTYLQEVATRMGVDISQWDMTGILIPEDRDGIITDRRAINRAVAARLAIPPATQPATAATAPAATPAAETPVATAPANAVDPTLLSTIIHDFTEVAYRVDGRQRVDQLRQQLASDEATLLSYERSYRAILESIRRNTVLLAEAERAAVNNEDAWRANLTRELTTALSGGFWIDPRWDNASCNLWLVTAGDVVISLRSQQAGLDLAVNLGRFAVRIYAPNNQIAVFPFERNIAVDNYPHPHIRHDGYICWGDVAAAMQQACVDGRWSVVLDTLRALLTTYSPGAPFRSIDRFVAGTPNYMARPVNMSALDRSRRAPQWQPAPRRALTTSAASPTGRTELIWDDTAADETDEDGENL